MSADLAPDWILQQALQTQRQAHTSWANTKPELDDGGLTLTVLGCGNIGTAILSGIMLSMVSDEKEAEPAPRRVPSKFIACVRSSESASRVKIALARYNARLTVYENDNRRGVSEADVLFLCCKPEDIRGILDEAGIRDGLAGKLLVSVCAGVTESQINDIIYKEASDAPQKCAVVRVVPNMAAAVRESMTVIAISDSPLPQETTRLVSWIFSRIGKVTHLPSANMDACTALCGSGTAFAALMVESLAAGAIVLGLSSEEAYLMAAQTMRGTTGLLLNGAETPAVLRGKVVTSDEGTSSGISVLEDGMLSKTVARAIQRTAESVSRIGESQDTNDV